MSAYSPYSIDIPFSISRLDHMLTPKAFQIVRNESFWKESEMIIGLYKHAAIRISLFNYVEK